MIQIEGFIKFAPMIFQFSNVNMTKKWLKPPI
jgi:hypothetical protein